jgi:hypothetical protein
VRASKARCFHYSGQTEYREYVLQRSERSFVSYQQSRAVGALTMYTDHATQTDNALRRSADSMATTSASSTSQTRLPISLKCLAIASDFERKLPLHFTLRQEVRWASFGPNLSTPVLLPQACVATHICHHLHRQVPNHRLTTPSSSSPTPHQPTPQTQRPRSCSGSHTTSSI